MSYKEWVPVQGEEVQVRYEDGYIEIAKFISDNGNGTCICRVGKRREVFQNMDVYENWNNYKKVKEDKDEDTKVSKKSRSDDYDFEKYQY